MPDQNGAMAFPPRISVVTPTLRRPGEVAGLIDNLGQQTVLPYELVLIDGAPAEEQTTETVVHGRKDVPAFACRYIRHGGGTAIQRNVGIDAAVGDFIAFVDDDIRLEADFFEQMIEVFAQDQENAIGGVAGYITNQHLDPRTSVRWQWYRRLNLFTTYEPGRYDFETGYPINRYLQPPHDGLRQIDFMGSNCAVWRRAVFGDNLRFSEFFRGFGVLEDAHLALQAGRRWQLMECGRARCIHLKSPGERDNHRRVARVSATNYRYVFVDIVPVRTWKQEFRFWRVQLFDLFRFLVVAMRSPQKNSWLSVLGKLEGLVAALRIWTTSDGDRLADCA